ncbi:MAG: hypothetical protein WD059_04690 [Balneolaceae bacterium]
MESSNSIPQQYKDEDLLTKMECCRVFCQELRIGKDTYYKNYHKMIKFKSYGNNNTVNRIPYKYVMHFINTIRGTASPEDPAASDILNFINFAVEEI